MLLLNSLRNCNEPDLRLRTQDPRLFPASPFVARNGEVISIDQLANGGLRRSEGIAEARRFSHPFRTYPARGTRRAFDAPGYSRTSHPDLRGCLKNSIESRQSRFGVPPLGGWERKPPKGGTPNPAQRPSWHFPNTLLDPGLRTRDSGLRTPSRIASCQARATLGDKSFRKT
jgi:hypothetical protein